MVKTIPDVWGKLWDLATAEPGGPARIEVDAEDAGVVTLVWPDGSKASLYWDNGDWQFHGALSDLGVGDVAARDRL